MNNSVIYLIINFLLYIFLVWKSYKLCNNRIGVTTIVIGNWAFAALSSILFFTHPFTASTEYYNEQYFWAFVYFGIINMMMFMSLYAFDNPRTKRHSITIKQNIVLMLIVVVLLYQIPIIIYYFPTVIKNATGDIGSLRNEMAEENITANVPGFVKFLNGHYMSFRNMVNALAFYAFFFVKKKRWLVNVFFVISLLMPFFTSMIYLMRSHILIQTVTIGVYLVIFREYISKSLKRKLIIVGGVLVSLVVLGLVYMSNARFDSLASWMYYKYAGETFVNFSGQLWPDLSGHTWGSAYFTRFVGVIGENFSTLMEKWQYISDITGIDPHIFYGYVGGMAIEFGWFVTFVVYALVAFLFYKKLKRDSSLSLSNLIIVSYIVNLLIYGIYIFPIQGWGNYEILYYLGAYIFVKHNEKRQKKYRSYNILQNS